MGLTAALFIDIQNDTLNLVVNLLTLFLVVVWFALVYWTYADAKRRIEDPMLVGCAGAAALFPFICTIVYMIVRPPEYIEDRHERELEIAAAEARLHDIQGMGCPHCGFEIEKTFLRCPSCLRRLKEPCTVCGKPLEPRWKICPYCEAEVGQVAQEPRPRRARRSTGPRAAKAAAPAQSPPPARAARSAAGGRKAADSGSTVESPAARPSRPPTE
jgi:double zinc ribbon protein